MGNERTATVSPRWTRPERSEDGTYWHARLVRPEDAGALDCDAYGPTEAACVRETVRQDRVWAARGRLSEGDVKGAGE
ncbi:hypothetical protein [Actinoallomurus rhizosphaericola]|uniref:hypothetical protein n=1 Tax=Actinoallomurus rhizosphaericola TaxID=2952536 RepID=UPI002093FC33|nr:hypothetical protein [Actinoallomurus rhizosphaericola]